jgi:hypothetical protein
VPKVLLQQFDEKELEVCPLMSSYVPKTNHSQPFLHFVGCKENTFIVYSIQALASGARKLRSGSVGILTGLPRAQPRLVATVGMLLSPRECFAMCGDSAETLATGWIDGSGCLRLWKNKPRSLTGQLD